MPDTSLNVGFGTPFQDQIDFLRNKLALPSQSWDDIQRSAHDRAFIVAGAAKADLVNDLQASLVNAAQTGAGLDAWRKDFKGIVAKYGWTGWTGEDSAGGTAWRTKVIYQTNMATSYAAGRYKQLTDPEYLKVRPYWRYIHADGVLHPRPQHLAWHGLTLKADDEFWKTHFPPNGWGCHCRVAPVSAKEGLASVNAGLGEPPAGWQQIDPKTGAQDGIDRGFDYAPGASTARSMQSLVNDKLINLDAPIGAAMWEVLKPVLTAERLAVWQGVVDATVSSMQATGTAALVHTVDPATVAALQANGVELANSAVWMRDTELLHAIRDTKTERGAVLPESVWRDLPNWLDSADPYLDTQDQALIYAMDLGARVGKVAVRVNFNEKGRFDGVRARIVSNFIQTGGMVNVRNITEPHFIPLRGN